MRSSSIIECDQERQEMAMAEAKKDKNTIERELNHGDRALSTAARVDRTFSCFQIYLAK